MVRGDKFGPFIIWAAVCGFIAVVLFMASGYESGRALLSGSARGAAEATSNAAWYAIVAIIVATVSSYLAFLSIAAWHANRVEETLERVFSTAALVPRAATRPEAAPQSEAPPKREFGYG